MSDRMPLTVVIAPDSFKGTLSAREAALAIASGWCAARPADELRLIPQADGGEGTLDAVASAIPAARLHDVGPVTGPDGRMTPGAWLELPDGTAVVELAETSGLPLMQRLDPLGAQTVGLGEVIRVALDAGAPRIVIGLGGSASTDGGAGALRSLGLRLTDAEGAEIAPGGAALARVARTDARGLRPPPPGGVVLLTDVDAPLLGPTGAAAVFGPQKGATAPQVAKLDAALARFAAVLGGDPDVPGSGAAGGTAFGFATAWGARIEPGADYLAQLTGLASGIRTADLVITGEGRFDATSLGGKVVGRLMVRAEKASTAVAIVAGQVSAPPRTSAGVSIWFESLVEITGSVEVALSAPAAAATEAGRRLAARWTARSEAGWKG